MAARNISLQYGLISVAVKSEVAVVKAPDMTNLCVGQPDKEAHDATPVKAPRTCDTCGPIVDYSALVKGVKQGKSYTLISQDEVAEAKESYAREYKGVVSLIPHPAQQFLGDTAPGDTLHYLTPADAASANHYQLLVKLIGSHPELAFGSLHTPVSATSPYLVRVREGVLVLEKRVRSQAMKPVPSVGGEVNEALYAMLETTLPNFVTDYDADAYEDKYEIALAEMLAKGEQVAIATDVAGSTPVHAQSDEDLMAKLKALTAVPDQPKKPAAKRTAKKAAPKKPAGKVA